MFNSALKDLPSENSEDILNQLAASSNLTLTRMQCMAPWVQGALRTIRANPLVPLPKAHKTAAEEAAERKQKILDSIAPSRGILSGLGAAARSNKKMHKRDVPPCNILTDDNLVLKQDLEGSFMTTDSLRELKETRAKEIEQMRKTNKRAGRSRSPSPQGSPTQR